MVKIKTFKTKEQYKKFIDKNKNKIQYTNIFINNVNYAIEYKNLLKYI